MKKKTTCYYAITKTKNLRTLSYARHLCFHIPIRRLTYTSHLCFPIWLWWPFFIPLIFVLRNTINDEKISLKIGIGEKKKIEDAIDQAI